MSKLIVDRVECIASTDHTGDDLYFLVLRMDAGCDVRRVGPNAAWHDMEAGDVRHTDVVLVDDNFAGTHIVAVIDEDDSFDFDAGLRGELSSGMRLVFNMFSPLQDHGRLTGTMMTAFANIIGKKRTNDDLLAVQTLGAGVMQVVGQGARYKINIKAA
ncbi:MAG: hypothetical protein ABW277_05560 [Longimicrobiaceae bacterium]